MRCECDDGINEFILSLPSVKGKAYIHKHIIYIYYAELSIQFIACGMHVFQSIIYSHPFTS